MQNQEFRFEAIGTSWEILIDERAVNGEIDLLKQKIFDRIDEFDKTYSRFRIDSLVTQMSQESGVFPLPTDAQPMIDFYRQLYEVTDGLVTPLIGNTMIESGYDAEYSLQPKELHVPLAWDDAMRFEGSALEIKKPVMLDFGAAGKGYLIDIIADLLRSKDFRNFSIDAGGDILSENMDMVIGLENPANFEQVIGTVKLNNKSIAASSGSRRKWPGFHHIIDPKKLKSPETVLSTWVIADSAMLADGLATALFLVEPATLVPDFDFEYLVLLHDFSVKRSGGFGAELFLA